MRMAFQERDAFFSQAFGKGLAKKLEISGSVGIRKEWPEGSETRCGLGEI